MTEENETPDLSTTQQVVANVNGVIVVASTIYSVYVLGKLAYDGGKAGVRILREKKAAKKND